MKRAGAKSSNFDTHILGHCFRKVLIYEKLSIFEKIQSFFFRISIGWEDLLGRSNTNNFG